MTEDPNEIALRKKMQEQEEAARLPWWFPTKEREYVADYLEETAIQYRELSNAYLALRAGIEQVLAIPGGEFTVHAVAGELNKLLEFPARPAEGPTKKGMKGHPYSVTNEKAKKQRSDVD